MDPPEIIRFIKGQKKKYGNDFSLTIKYETASGKVRKRYGRFVDLVEEEELILYNPDKKTEGRFQLENIRKIDKR